MAKSAILSVKIVGESDKARREIRQTEQALGRLGASAAKSTVQQQRMYKALDGAANATLKIGALATAVGGLTIVTARAVTALAPLSGYLTAAPGTVTAAAAAFATFKTATAGFSDALKAASKGGKDWDEAVKGMPPAMREAVKATAALGESFKKTQSNVQQSFWQGLSKDITSLGRTALPVVESGMTRVAAAGNGMVSAILKAGQTQPVMAAVSASFSLAERVIKSLTPAMAPFAQGLAILTKASADLIPGFDGAAGAAQRFSDWATKVTSNGQFASWLAQAGEAGRALWSTLGSLVSIVVSVGKAALDAAGDGGALPGFANSLKTISAEIAKPEIQTMLRDAFAQAAAIIQVVTNLFVMLLPYIIQFGPALLVMAAAWKVGTLAVAAYNAANTLAVAIQSAFGATATASLAKVAAGWVVAGAQALLAGAKMAAAWLLGLGPIGLIIAAIALVVGAFVLAYNKCEWFRNGVNAVASAVAGFFSNAAGAIGRAFSSAIGGILSMFEGLANAAWNVASRISGFFSGIVDRANSIRNSIGSIFNSGTMWLKPAVPSTLPDVGLPFYLTAAGISLAPASWGQASSSSVQSTVYNIKIESLDPSEAARQVRDVINRDARRDGRVEAGVSLW